MLYYQELCHRKDSDIDETPEKLQNCDPGLCPQKLFILLHLMIWENTRGLEKKYCQTTEENRFEQSEIWEECLFFLCQQDCSGDSYTVIHRNHLKKKPEPEWPLQQQQKLHRPYFQLETSCNAKNRGRQWTKP